MRYKSFSYLALVDEENSPGVVKKIHNTVIAAQHNGLHAEKLIFATNFKGVMQFFKALLGAKTDVIMIRFSDLIFPLVFFALLLLRLRGRRVIVDVPTPRITGLREMDSLITNPLKRAIRKSISYFSASWVLMPANLIIQYADEGK